MKTAAALLATLLTATPLRAEDIPVPSGRSVTLIETFWEEGPLLRLRFVSEAVADGQPWEAAAPDMLHLCESMALKIVADTGRTAETIMISLADRPSEFGQMDPDLIQFFEAFRPEDGTCMLEGF